jgi:hypothetical protein
MKLVLSFQCIFLILITIKSLARKFAQGIEVAAQSLEAPGIQDHLKMQKDYVNRFYNWNVKSVSWTRFLQGAINAK